MRVGPALVTAVLLLGAATACANPSYDDSSAHDMLVTAGLTEQQAHCVTRGLDSRIGIRRLDAHATPTDTEREKTNEVLEQCGVDVTQETTAKRP
jgi:hypothetical protein